MPRRLYGDSLVVKSVLDAYQTVQEFYERPDVPLDLKIRMVNAEAVDALLYGCVTWTTRPEHYKKLRTVHHRVLLGIIGARRRRSDHRVLSYNRALELPDTRVSRPDHGRGGCCGRGV